MISWPGKISRNLYAAMLYGLIVSIALWCLPTNTADAARVVAEKRECATCHIAWMSEFKREDVLTLVPYEPRPVEKTGKQDVVSTEMMCFSCHDGFVLDSRPLWLEGRHNHPVGMEPSEKVQLPQREGKTVFPLNDDGKVYCGTCHSAHGLSWQETESPIFLRIPNVQSSMCMTCHEGPATEKKGINHPVMKALDRIPEKLVAVGGKFGKEKEVICQSCHTPHAARSKPLTVMDNRQAQLCGQCHEDKANVSGTKHDLSVMAPESKNRKGEAVKEYGPCLACHVLHDADDTAPLWGGETIVGKDRVRGLCESCHNPEGLAKKKIIANHSHPTNVSVDKLGISSDGDSWQSRYPLQGSSLKPLPLFDAEGHKSKDGTLVNCLSCHDPHTWSMKETEKGDPKKTEGDGQSSFLRIAQGSDSGLCINCHVDKRSVLMSKHRLDNGKERQKLQQSAAIDGKLDQGVCGSCHRAHNGKGPVMTPIKRQKSQGAIQSICGTCHVQGGIAGKKLTGEHSHPLQKNLANMGGKTSLPLFDKAGKRHPRGRVDCATCHDPHQWDPTKPLSTAGKDKEVDGDAKTSFLRKPAAPSADLCVDCHRNKRPVRGTDHDLRVTANKATNHQGRDVRQTGVCGQCHSVHNANSRLMLWARKTSPDLDPQIALCLSCHSEGGAAEAKIPKRIMRPHGILVWSNEIRAEPKQRHLLPEIPVFDLRGNRVSVGRVRCTSCHNPHVWDVDNPREGKGKNIEGDVTNSFLRNASSSQTVCVDCHGKDALFRYKYFHGETSRKPYYLSK